MRHRAPDRSRLMVGALAALIAVGVAACWNAPADRRLQASGGVIRLGVSGQRLVLAGVSKPVLEAGTGDGIAVSAGPLPAGSIELAVTLQAEPTGPGPAVASCRAALAPTLASADTGRDTAQRGTGMVELDAISGRWTESTLSFSQAIESGVNLRLDCDAPAGTRARWAQPIAIGRRGAGSAPLVVLISLDTLRADHVSGFGAPSGQTPQLEALGREGIRLLNASSEGTWTLPSHYAMLRSGLYGFRLGRGRPLALPELLRDRGFLTLASTGGGFVGAFFYFDQGFDHFDERWGASDDLSAQVEEIVARIERSSSVPTFLFFHTYAVHEKSPIETAWYAEHGSWKRFRPDAEQVASIRDFYAARVQRVDRELAPLFEALRRASRSRQVLLVVTSDHGEAFLEHGGFRHGYNAARYSLHDELTHIPLLVWGPGLIPGDRYSREPAMLADLAPSLLEAVGAAVPTTMVGRSLWPLWSDASEGESGAGPRGAVSQTQGSWALRESRYKLIAGSGDTATRTLELYELESDPAEQDDLADREPERARAMLGRLRGRLDALGVPSAAEPLGLPDCPLCEMRADSSFLGAELSRPSSRPATDRESVREETRERLRALGYLD